MCDTCSWVRKGTVVVGGFGPLQRFRVFLCRYCGAERRVEIE